MPYPDDEWQRQHMAERAEMIWQWKAEYYKGYPSIDDQTFDLHWRNLLYLEAKYPHLKPANSPTDAAGMRESDMKNDHPL